MKPIFDVHAGGDIDLRLMGHHTYDRRTISEGRQMGSGSHSSFSFMDYLFKLFWNQHYKDSLRVGVRFLISICVL